MLKIINLSKKFNDRKILDNVSLTVGRGEVVLLLGSSGVGKSTLLRVLNNLESIDEGTVELDGATLDLTTVNKSHQIGMVFQQFNLFDAMTARENITFPLERAAGFSKKEATRCANELLEKYGLEERADALASSLSGGQKQRLAIARTLALKPRVVCMDEPTSALDPLLKYQVAHTIQDLATQGYSVLVATHDTGLIDFIDCTIHLMREGKIVETAASQLFREAPEDFPFINTFVYGHKKSFSI